MRKLQYCGMAVCMAVAAAGLLSCGGPTGSSQEKIDSLQALCNQREADYNQLNEYVTVIAEGLDSIALQQDGLFKGNNVEGESPLPNRDQIKANLETFKQVLARQKERIDELEKSLATSKGNASKLRTLVTAMKSQLEEKDKLISQLQMDINNKNVSIADLMNRVDLLTQQHAAQEKVISQQADVIDAQDAQLNTVFIKMATKKQLKDMGLLDGGGLFKKSKVDYDNLDKTLFMTADKRQLKELPILSKKAKIMTSVPDGTYSLDKDGSNMRLRITNADRFWSVSKYLIIQID